MGDISEKLLAILKTHALPVEHDPVWESPCAIGETDSDGMIRWQPIEMTPLADFTDVEANLGFALHPDAKEFYGNWFAGPVTEFRHSGEVVMLNTIWNYDEFFDFKRSILEHVIGCRADGRRPSVFIANTESDCFFSIDNDTGEVVLEEPGSPERKSVSANLATFLDELLRLFGH